MYKILEFFMAEEEIRNVLFKDKGRLLVLLISKLIGNEFDGIIEQLYDIGIYVVLNT